ncbi:RNA-binding cell elongation regulator Jag/EloR [Lacticaseibacillus parakribbianus]|uniref:RNA-binding cell elongation regulator Jag/EloR n=1 Tax=Lacticaseibacillus parakribbianus TaxID=2970927 RepID=UPI0021CB4404|nr:RNA-binding cell elongation regulator Jag/EloR [Lacticaseibacillus parakribbianus]
MPTFQGATIQKAIDAGLVTLGVAREQVAVEVIQEGKHGLFGLGRQQAIVNLSVQPATAASLHADPVPEKPAVQAAPAPAAAKPEHQLPLHHLHEGNGLHRDDQTAIALVQSYLEDITRELGLAATIDNTREGDQVWFDLATDKEALLIGKHGKIINAIQYLAQTEFNHYGKSKWTVMLNVGDYRQRRDAAVRRLAEKSAREVVARGASVYLDPMPSFERKAIHATLADSPYVDTHSEGTDPRRYVVVTPKGRSL